MTGLLSLLFGVLAVAWCTPPILHALLRRGVDPQGVLVLWGVLVSTSFFTVTGSLLAALLPTHSGLPWLLQLLHHCWNSLRHGFAPQVHNLTAALLLSILVSAVVLTVRNLVHHLHRQRRLHRRQVELLRIAARAAPGPIPTMWLPHAGLLAYSVAGRRGFVVVSEGLREQLSDTGCAAVIEHERAHLRGRHHLLVGLAEALAASAPWLPLTGHSPTLVRTAVELAADRTAARTYGAVTVRSALLAMSQTPRTAPPPALGMAQECVALRLRHLRSSRATVARLPRRMLASGLAALVGLSLPVAGGIGVLLMTEVAVCFSALGG
ncbi:M56 family metallopeptidase [Actinopolyspora halophila]|uniref:M56 family metallopeptidase n=1 Tax=Actinopolyspora halophila TaxID=1850 RepID=UPI00036C775E|nr:M56 family metallopeptidase [Actinopolyspora halophila]